MAEGGGGPRLRLAMRLAALGLLVSLAACGGGGSEPAAAPPAVPPVSGPPPAETAATLAPGVIVLTEAQNAARVSASATRLEYAGAFAAAPGQVLLTEDSAYKVVRTTTSGGNTLIDVEAPTMGEIFQRLRINAAVAASDVQVVDDVSPGIGAAGDRARPLSLKRPAAVSADGSASFDWELPADGGLTSTGTLTARFKATVDYEFTAAAGLKSATVDLQPDIVVDSTAQFKLSGKEIRVEYPLGKALYFPIRVSLFDAALNAVGVRLAGLLIPLSVGASAKTSLTVSVRQRAELNASLKLQYQGGSPLVTGAATGTFDWSDPRPDLPNDARPGIAINVDRLHVYAQARPALAFMKTVGLLGLELRAGPAARGKVTPAQLTPELLVCNDYETTIDLDATGFFKSVGIDELRTPTYTSSHEPRKWTFGRCLLDTDPRLRAVVPAEIRLLEPFSLTAALEATRPDLVPIYAPGRQPGGRLKIAVGNDPFDRGCDAEVIDGVATCLLVASTAGDAVPVRFDYSGDEFFQAELTEARTDQPTLRILRARTTTELIPPAAVAVGVPARFRAYVSSHGNDLRNVAYRLNAGSTVGFVEFRDGAGRLLCTAPVQDFQDTACEVLYPALGSQQVVANYVGTNLFEPSSSPVTPVNVVTDTHWEISYRFATCSADGGFGWAWMPPCFAVLPTEQLPGAIVTSATNFLAYFEDATPEVVFEAPGLARGFLGLGWKTTDSVFAARWDYVQPLDFGPGQRSWRFIVESRAENRLGGRLEGAFDSGYYVNALTLLIPGGVASKPTVASGTWTAERRAGRRPALPVLNGQDWCNSSGVGSAGLPCSFHP